MGGVLCGNVVARATVLNSNKWVELEELHGPDPVIARGGRRASDYLKEKLADPARAQRVARLRNRIGQALAEDHGRETLSTLRMRAGLSQSALAEKMGTQQPNIARWERSPAGIQFENVIKLARALGVSNETITNTIAQQLETPDPSFSESSDE